MAQKKIEDLTIGEAKKRLDETLDEYLELTDLFGKSSQIPKNKPQSAGVAASAIGEYVLVRSRNEGINAGTVLLADDTGIVLENACRLWYHKPAVKTESWYEGVANHGLSADSKCSGTVSRKIIVEDYSITVCSEAAQKSIESTNPYAKN